MASTWDNNKFKESVFNVPEYPLDDAIEWIQENMDPEDVFTDVQLSDWADDNGYVKEDEA